jgi:hypothetical protein
LVFSSIFRNVWDHLENLGLDLEFHPGWADDTHQRQDDQAEGDDHGKPVFTDFDFVHPPPLLLVIANFFCETIPF